MNAGDCQDSNALMFCAPDLALSVRSLPWAKGGDHQPCTSTYMVYMVHVCVSPVLLTLSYTTLSYFTLSCYFTELLLDWTVTVTWLNSYFTELLLDWTVTLQNCYLTELLFYWTVTWLSCYLTELLLDWLFACLNLRNSEVSQLNFLWLFWKILIYIYIYIDKNNMGV